MTTVRPLTAADRAEWQPRWEGYLGFHRASPDAAWSETLTSFRVYEHEL
jgi:hypothetical protein